MSVLPTEKVQEMITKLQEYRASVLVKIDDKRIELEALLERKIQHARLDERRRCALLLQSLAKHHSDARCGADSPVRNTVTTLRITTPPPSANGASASLNTTIGRSDASSTASATVVTQAGRTVAPPDRGSAGRHVTTGMDASLVDTVVVSPLTDCAESSLDASCSSWMPAVLEFLKLAHNADAFPSWSFTPNTLQCTTPRTDAPATHGVCGKHVRFSSKSPQVAMYSVERSPSGPVLRAEHTTHESTPIESPDRTGHVSFSSDSTCSSRSSAEIRATFQRNIANVHADITSARSALDDSLGHPRTPRGRMRRADSEYPTEAATPTRPVADDTAPVPNGWLDRLSPQDTDAAHENNSAHPSLSFTGTALLRPAPMKATRARLPAGHSVLVDLSTMPVMRSAEGWDEEGEHALHLGRARKARAVEPLPSSSRKRTRPAGLSYPTKGRNDPCSQACKTGVPRALPTQVQGVCGNISLACGPTLYFSE